jgi:hypothetical protein
MTLPGNCLSRLFLHQTGKPPGGGKKMEYGLLICGLFTAALLTGLIQNLI